MPPAELADSEIAPISDVRCATYSGLDLLNNSIHNRHKQAGVIRLSRFYGQNILANADAVISNLISQRLLRHINTRDNTDTPAEGEVDPGEILNVFARRIYQDVNHDWYINEAVEMLYDCGAYKKAETAQLFF